MVNEKTHNISQFFKTPRQTTSGYPKIPPPASGVSSARVWREGSPAARKDAGLQKVPADHQKNQQPLPGARFGRDRDGTPVDEIHQPTGAALCQRKALEKRTLTMWVNLFH